MEENLFGWMVGLVMYLLVMTRDAYRVCYAPIRAEIAAINIEDA